MPDILSNLWNTTLWFISIFIFIAYLMALFSIITDLFRDRELGGGAKAVWFIALIFLPLLTALVYLIVRGKGMGERTQAQVAANKAATDSYIRTVAGGPADEIAQAQKLLADGAINQDEFQALKRAALSKA
ncbi:MAG TPA: SHOCT domain-containing protein [Arachnia sp.]|nr:SHOCT domain-containing protein [Arachnia sp.]HMT86849.1 SHOCT domain-containing protein [Arachnia sp.]